VWDVLRAVDEDAAGDWEPRSAYNPTEAPHALLAQTIAERIKKWCAEGQNVAGQHIPVKPGDIMILVRKRNELVQALVRELKERAIPVSGVDRMQLSTQIGVRDLLAVIQFALLPEDDLNLACILRGPLIGMDETTLEDVCHPRPKGIYVWSALRDSAHPVAQTAYAWLDGIRDLADRLTPYDFFTHILTHPCPAGRSGRLALRARLGADATDPIDELLNRAQDFAQRHTPALQNFLCAMQRDDSTIKRDLDHGAGEVRIMTVHAAKGLQAPIVILPDTCSLPQKLPALQWDVVTFLPYYTGGDTKTCDGFADALRQGAQDAQLAEYRRLLYVALTRAENQIYIYGYLGKNESKADHWHKLIRAALCPDREAAPGQALVCLADQNVPGVLGDTPTAPVPTSSASLPEWAFKPAAPESAVRSLSPSQLAADDDAPASPAQAAGRDQAARGR
ncbi:MAG: 3'-5' exonuclease, partial [Hyphomicrobium sp.]